MAIKPLLDFAPKELSQDAFLIYLFENQEQDEFYPICSKLIELWTGITNPRINRSELFGKRVGLSQCRRIDVLLSFLINDIPYLIVLEDKVFSYHSKNQMKKSLENAQEIVNKTSNCYQKVNIVPVFLKSTYLCQTTDSRNPWIERREVQESYQEFLNEYKGKNVIGKLIINDLDDLYLIFKDTHVNNENIQAFADKITTWHNLAHDRNFKLSETHGKGGFLEREYYSDKEIDEDLLHFYGLFKRLATQVDSKFETSLGFSKEYNYVWLKAFAKNHKFDLPRFEIRSRDFKFKERKLFMRLVTWGLDPAELNAELLEKCLNESHIRHKDIKKVIEGKYKQICEYDVFEADFRNGDDEQNIAKAINEVLNHFVAIFNI